MAVTKKPRINIENADSFIDNAKASNGIPQKRDNVKTAKKKLTFYMDHDMYLLWKEYQYKQIVAGKKVSFQSVVEGFMKSILK